MQPPTPPHTHTYTHITWYLAKHAFCTRRRNLAHIFPLPDPIHSSPPSYRSESTGARGADRAQMLPVCLGDWGDWCHGVLEPLKCRPSVNMTKARPALSPG